MYSSLAYLSTILQQFCKTPQSGCPRVLIIALEVIRKQQLKIVIDDFAISCLKAINDNSNKPLKIESSYPREVRPSKNLALNKDAMRFQI